MSSPFYRKKNRAMLKIPILTKIKSRNLTANTFIKIYSFKNSIIVNPNSGKLLRHETNVEGIDEMIWKVFFSCVKSRPYRAGAAAQRINHLLSPQKTTFHVRSQDDSCPSRLHI